MGFLSISTKIIMLPYKCSKLYIYTKIEIEEDDSFVCDLYGVSMVGGD